MDKFIIKEKQKRRRLWRIAHPKPARARSVPSYLVGFSSKGGLTREVYLVGIAGRPKPAVCEICGSSKPVRFDHDHKTGKFRGWICDRCNLTLGLVGDSKELLAKLSDYLR